jgi:GcrA cell cycle regulator
MLSQMPGPRVTRNAVIGKLTRLGMAARKQYAGNAGVVKKRKPGPPRAPSAKAKSIRPQGFKPPVEGPVRERGAIKGDWNVRFAERAHNQCPMFVLGEEGAQGLVCGREVSTGSYCEQCAQIVFQPAQKEKAA